MGLRPGAGETCLHQGPDRGAPAQVPGLAGDDGFGGIFQVRARCVAAERR